MMEGKAGELFYVNVKNAVDIRRNVLETTKSTINTLQKLAKFKVIREQKEANLKRLNDLVHELEAFSSRFKGILPNVKDKQLSTIGIKKKKEEKKVEKKTPEEKKADKKTEADLEQLEGAIKNIEAKLNLMVKE